MHWLCELMEGGSTGILAMGATNNFINANFILGQANLVNPSYIIERWHIALLSYLVAPQESQPLPGRIL